MGSGNPAGGGAAKNNTAVGSNAAAGATGVPVAQVPAPTVVAPAPSPVAGSAAAPAPAPLDATATQNIANYIAGVNNKVSNLGLQRTGDQTAYQDKLNQINFQEPLTDLKLETNANAGGGFYGSAYGQQLGNLGQSFTMQRGDLSDNLNSQLGLIANSIAQLQGSIPSYEAGQGIASAWTVGCGWLPRHRNLRLLRSRRRFRRTLSLLCPIACCAFGCCVPGSACCEHCCDCEGCDGEEG